MNLIAQPITNQIARVRTIAARIILVFMVFVLVKKIQIIMSLSCNQMCAGIIQLFFFEVAFVITAIPVIVPV